MNKTKGRITSLLLAVCIIFSATLTLSSCGGYTVETFDGKYTYNDAVAVLSTNWNPHTYQTTDESYPMDFISIGLYSFIFNDEINPVEGKEPYSGYRIVPEMAAELPIDVTEAVKAADDNKYGIPEGATSGYAYTIRLNPDARWENGEPINADTYVYSMKELLNPKLMNYRATDYYSGQLCIAGAELYANQGRTVDISVNNVIANESLSGLDAFLSKYSRALAYVNWDYSFGDTYNPATGKWTGTALDETVKTDITVTDMYELFVETLAGEGYDEETAREIFLDEVSVEWSYPSDVSFDTVGIYKSDEYEITLVLAKSLAGFNLLYSLTGNWIVYEELYEAGKTQVQGSELWVTNYGTSVATTMSYGPYKLTGMVSDASMTFDRNDNWYGYGDGKHVYKDPVDGKVYPMYQTNKIFTRVVEEAETRKLMFLEGELMEYGLQTEDFAEYRDSDYCYSTPSETVFFFIFNGYMKAIKEREKNLNTAQYDLETMTLESFRRAIALTYDKEALSTAISPSRSGGYGLIGDSYIYDPDTGARYRDTEQAKRALCDFYSVNPDDFDSLDEAVDSITGYDPVKAKELFTAAFVEAKGAGYITDKNGDGISDQTVQITYASSTSSDFITKTLNYLNEKLAEVALGTPFEGKIVFVESAPLGNNWSSSLKNGLSDTVLAGWSGSALDPFGLSDLYTNPSYQYDAKWFDSSKVSFALEVNTASIGEPPKKETVEMSIRQWSDALNGATVTVGGKQYCFGDGIADVDTRLDILAKIESTVLMTYNYIPMLQDASMALLSKQVYYVVEEYNPIMGRGGIRYLKYNYNDEEWAEYVSSQGGEIAY